ncbi:MAG: hypothetical protein II779_15045 [Clostridia bacterium]|nr:hypothetical protein [Clostridia bacterium]
MTVQLPVLVWTVICFCLFALILHFMLFKPLLSHMDRRSEKIARAKEKKREREEALAAAGEALAQFRAGEEEHLRALAQAETEAAGKEAKALTDEAERRRGEAVGNAASELGKEREKLGILLAGREDEFAAALAGALTESLPGPGNTKTGGD